jgi:hypothetical protein
MIDFATVKGLTIPEGVVTQITDASGRVLWVVKSEEPSAPIVLEVAKVTTDTYAGGSTYMNEEFILLDIYPKTASSKVNVTYGGLTKTLTFSGTNAQQVYFGTFNGVADEVETPASGTLTIEGGCVGFGCSSFSYSSKYSGHNCPCITAVTEWGEVANIPDHAFYKCEALALTSLPSGITSIGKNAFCDCTSLALTELPSGITEIPDHAFYNCYDMDISEIPEGVTSIGDYAFYMENMVTSHKMFGNKITLPSTLQSFAESAFIVREAMAGGTDYYWYISHLTVLATTPPTFATYNTTLHERTTITVPAGCGEVYKAAEGWNAYASQITEAS